MEVKDLPGVGEKLAKNLEEAGYPDLMSIAVSSPSELAEVEGIKGGIATKIIQAARKTVKVGKFETADVLLERRKDVGKVTTGSQNLNKLMGGGFETQALIELFGPYGSGKTQIAHQVAVDVQLPQEKGGLDGDVIYIDTENTFRPERIVQMAKALELKPKKAVTRVHVARAYNSHHQMLLVEKAKELAKKIPARLLVVDSLTAYFRAEYVGRGALAERQQKLNKHMHDLQRFADLYNATVVATNQVLANPALPYGDPTTPIGGHVVGHTATFRIYLKRSRGDKRIARLVDSPSLPEAETVIKLTTEGIRD